MGGKSSDTFVLFCSLSLLLIICVYELKRKYKIPTTPCLVLMGLIYRFIANSISTTKGIVEMIDGINAEVINYAILPAIIYQSAAFLDWYRLKKGLGQILPLASTVVILSAFLSACAIKYVFMYEYSWGKAFLLGIIVNATDHVSIKSLLKDTPINDRLESLLKGETLLNSATVLVMFKVTVETTLGNISGVEIFTLVLRFTLGGVALGWFFSFVMGKILKRLINSNFQETNITFVFTYLLFWTCNSEYFNMSGAVAVVISGLYMAQYGKTFISPAVFKKLKHFWTIYVNNIECLVFIIAGMILGKYFESNDYLNFSDLGKAWGLFLFLYIFRGLVLLLHYPLLKHFGYGVNFKEILVLAFAGLKGVISICLALMVYNNKGLDMDYRSTLLFFSIMISTFSVTLDTIISKWLVHKLELNIISPVEENLVLGVTTTILQQTADLIDSLRNHNDYRLVKWDDVLDIAGPKMLLEEVMKGSKSGKNFLEHNLKESTEKLIEIYNNQFNINETIYSEEVRKRFFSTLKGLYWRSYTKGECFASTVLHLINCCNKSLDKEDKPMQDWNDFQGLIYNSKKIQLYKRLGDWPIFGKIFRRLAYNSIVNAYDIALTFQRAHYKAEEIMDKMEKDLEHDTFERIMDESHIQILSCKDFIKEYITDSYPDIIAEVQGKMSCFLLLNKQRKMVNLIYKQGLIKELEYQHLYDSVNENLAQLTFMSHPEILTMEAILRKRFKKTSSDEIKKILPLVVEKHFKPESILFEKNSAVQGAYLIFSGVIYEHGDLVDHELVKGNIAGAFYLLPEFHDIYLTTAITRTVVIAAFIPIGVLTSFFHEDVYQEAAKQFIMYYKERLGLKETPTAHINKILENSTVLHLYASSPLNLRRGALVMKGRVQKGKDAFSMIRPCKQIIESLDEAVVLIFPPHFGNILRQHLLLSDAFASYYIRSPPKKVENKVIDELKIGSFKINQIDTTHDLK